MFKRIAALLTVGTLGVLSAGLAVVVADRTSPVVDVKYVIADTPVPTPGGLVHIEVNIFYRRTCHVTVIRKLYDANGAVETLPNYVSETSPLGAAKIAYDFPLLETFAPGEARYVSTPIWACNWFQRAFWPLEGASRVVDFIVYPRSGSAVTTKEKSK